MQKKLSTSTHPRTARLGSALTMSVVLLFLLLQVTSLSYAVPQKSKKVRMGSIKILTTPGGLPLEIDGRPEGETTTDYRSFDLAPGVHTLTIQLPNNERSTKDINLVSGHIRCITLAYRPEGTGASTPPPASATPDAQVPKVEVLNTAFSDGAELAGTISDCGVIAVPKVPWWKKKVIRKKS